MIRPLLLEKIWWHGHILSFTWISGGGTTLTPTTPGTTTTPSSSTTTTPSIMTPGTNTPTSTTPYGSTAPTGVLGGVSTGLGPSGTTSTNTDDSHGGLRLQPISSFTILLFSGFMLIWGWILQTNNEPICNIQMFYPRTC